jgi:hypothetical protein
LSQLLELEVGERQGDLAEVIRVQYGLIGERGLVLAAIGRIVANLFIFYSLNEILHRVAPIQMPYAGIHCFEAFFFLFFSTHCLFELVIL